MKIMINNQDTVKNLDGETMRESEPKLNAEGRIIGYLVKGDLTIKNCIIDSILNYQDQKEVQKVKLSRFQLAKKLKAIDGEVELTTDEIGLIHQYVSAIQNALVFGQIYEYLEGIK